VFRWNLGAENSEWPYFCISAFLNVPFLQIEQVQQATNSWPATRKPGCSTISTPHYFEVNTSWWTSHAVLSFTTKLKSCFNQYTENENYCKPQNFVAKLHTETDRRNVPTAIKFSYCLEQTRRLESAAEIEVEWPIHIFQLFSNKLRSWCFLMSRITLLSFSSSYFRIAKSWKAFWKLQNIKIPRGRAATEQFHPENFKNMFSC